MTRAEFIQLEQRLAALGLMLEGLSITYTESAKKLTIRTREGECILEERFWNDKDALEAVEYLESCVHAHLWEQRKRQYPRIVSRFGKDLACKLDYAS